MTADLSTVAGLAFVVAFLVQLTKFALNYAIKPTDPNQNAIVRLYVVLLSEAVVLGNAVLSGPLNLTDVRTNLILGFSVAMTAMLQYHVLTSASNALPIPTALVGVTPAPVPVLTPEPAPAAAPQAHAVTETPTPAA